jgi:hypothetical protein
VIPAAPQAIDMVVARKLWDVSAEMVQLPATTLRFVQPLKAPSGKSG